MVLLQLLVHQQYRATTTLVAITAVDSLNVDGAVVVGAGISAVGDVTWEALASTGKAIAMAMVFGG